MHDDDDKIPPSQATGPFIRPPKSKIQDDVLDQPTQKIILFPTEQVKQENKNPSPPSEQTGALKPPIRFTSPLPKLSDLPKVEALPDDFMGEHELDELDWEEKGKTPDFSKYLKGDKDDLASSIAEFPKEHRKLAKLLQELSDKADKFSESMYEDFENEDREEIERLERLIPGTDKEEGKRIAAPPPRKKEKSKKEKKAPPNIHPKKLGAFYQRGLKTIKLRRITVELMAIFTIVFTLFPQMFPFIGQGKPQIALLGGFLVLGSLLSYDLLIVGFLRGLQLKIGMDTLSLFSGLFCALDCFVQFSTPEPRSQLPFVSLVLLNFALQMYGEQEKKWAHLRACRVATLMEHPFLITLEPHKWNGKAAYTKSTANPRGFTSQLQEDDGAQVAFSYIAPVFLIGSFFTALKLTHNSEDFVWAISALLIASTPLASGTIYGRSAHNVAKRLGQLRSTLAGWPGVSKTGRQCIVSDTDLFPAGAITFNGTCLYHGFKEKKVLAYTTSLVTAGELGCSRLFEELMVVRNFITPEPRELAFHEAGGISARIGPDAVLVGNADFMELMQIPIPDGMHVTHTVFCSINGRLAGLYTLLYKLPYLVEQSMEILQLERIRPVLATRDFALTPDMLEGQFGLRRKHMDFPSILRRQDLSRSDRPLEGQLTAMVTREGLEPVSDCVIAAGRLRRTVYMGVALSLLSATLGFALVAYLVGQLSYTALSPLNMTIFMCLWLPPFWVVTDLPHRF